MTRWRTAGVLLEFNRLPREHILERRECYSGKTTRWIGHWNIKYRERFPQASKRFVDREKSDNANNNIDQSSLTLEIPNESKQPFENFHRIVIEIMKIPSWKIVKWILNCSVALVYQFSCSSTFHSIYPYFRSFEITVKRSRKPIASSKQHFSIEKLPKGFHSRLMIRGTHKSKSIFQKKKKKPKFTKSFSPLYFFNHRTKQRKRR